MTYTVVLSAADSTDTRFDNLDAPYVTVTNTDDDLPVVCQWSSRPGRRFASTTRPRAS